VRDTLTAKILKDKQDICILTNVHKPPAETTSMKQSDLCIILEQAIKEGGGFRSTEKEYYEHIKLK
jgi:hypothetical protein